MHQEFPIRVVIGMIFLGIAVVGMILPFLPIGWLFLFAGLLVLSPIIPALQKAINKGKKKVDKNMIEKAEKLSDNAIKKTIEQSDKIAEKVKEKVKNTDK